MTDSSGGVVALVASADMARNRSFLVLEPLDDFEWVPHAARRASTCLPTGITSVVPLRC